MAGDDGTPASGRKSKQADDEVEPVFFHGKCSDLYEELLWTLGGPSKIKQIIDFCPGEGALAQVALRKRLPYCAFCFTEHHLSGLQDHLVKMLLKLFVEEGSEFYKPGLAATMKDVEAEEEDPNTEDPISDDKKPSPAAEKKTKGKGKGGKKKGAGKGKGKRKGGKKPKLPKAVVDAQGGDGSDQVDDPEEDDHEPSEDDDSQDDIE